MLSLPRFPKTPIPGPAPLPLLGRRGNVFRFFSDPTRETLDLERRYGDIVAVTRHDPAVICGFGAEHNRRVLTDTASFHNVTQLLFPVPQGSALDLLSRNMMLSNGESHRRQRRLMMNPAFLKANIEGHRDAIVELAERSLHKLEPGQTVDIAQVTEEISLRIAMRCFFGHEVRDDADDLGRLGIELNEGLMSPAAMVLPLDLPGTPYAKLLRVAGRVEDKTRELIQQRRRSGAGKDVLSVLIQARDEVGGSLADDELVANAALLFSAGYETTARTLGWTLFLLGQHPEALADLEDELQGALRGDAPTADQVGELSLLDAVVKESMRLLPSAPILAPRLTTDKVAFGPYELPRGAMVILSPLVTHRSPDLYPRPARFLPSRWMGLQRSPYEYMPFGAGARMCVGAGFAALAVRVILAMTVQRFRLHLVPGARVSRQMRGIIMGTKHGLPMVVEKRSGAKPRRPSADVRGDIHELVDLR